jgi:hypothetical protein
MPADIFLDARGSRREQNTCETLGMEEVLETEVRESSDIDRRVETPS